MAMAPSALAAAQSTAPKVTTSSVEEAQRSYPQHAWAFNHPEVGPLLRQAIEQGWAEGRLTGAVMATNWWKATAPAMREFQMKKANDPEAIEQEIRRRLPDIWDTWLGLGMTPPSLDDRMMYEIAEQAISFNFSEGQLRDAIVGRVAWQGKTPVGSLGTSMNDIKQRAQRYYVPIDDATAFQMARQVAAGEHKAEDFDIMFADQAKGRFPTLAKYIDQGIAPADFFKPYQQTLAQLLEKPADQIDFLNDQRWSKVIDTFDEKTKERRPMTLSEVQTYGRGLDEWKTTKQGQEAASNMADFITKTFGKVA